MQVSDVRSGPLQEVSGAFAHFNDALFDGKLPPAVVCFQSNIGSGGYLHRARWAHTSGETEHQISMNPYYFAKRPVQEIFQTLVHQMCHLWQVKLGKPSRLGYHNLEWARKMMSVGLTPTSTGKQGGKLVGQHMLETVDDGGRFQLACLEYLDTRKAWHWLDRYCEPLAPQKIQRIPMSPSQILTAPVHAMFTNFAPVAIDSRAKLKTKYECPKCGANVWGKPELSVACGDCLVDYVAAVKEPSHGF